MLDEQVWCKYGASRLRVQRMYGTAQGTQVVQRSLVCTPFRRLWRHSTLQMPRAACVTCGKCLPFDSCVCDQVCCDTQDDVGCEANKELVTALR